MTLNLYAVIVLVAVVGEYLLTVIASVLNMRAAMQDLPDEFTDVYDRDAYRRSHEYSRQKFRFNLLTETFGIILLLGFWFSGGFAWLDELVRGWWDDPILQGLSFIGLLLLGQMLLSLPFTIYYTFVIEERFGFNRTTPGTFILDRIKGLLLTIVLGGPLLAGVLWFFQTMESQAWLYAWGVAGLFLLILQYIVPTWIMPLFNKFTPLDDGELRRDILDYAARVDFPLSNVFVMDGSKRSSRSNAFFTGLGRNRMVALFDTLIEQHSVPELVAVVAHEVGHYKRRHIIQGMVISFLHIGVLFLFLQYFINQPGLFTAFGIEQPSIHAGLVFFALLFSPIELILSIVMHILSRRNEFEADEFAARTTRDSGPMIAALKKLSADNLQNLTPHPFYVFLYYSHPPVLARIRALSALSVAG